MEGGGGGGAVDSMLQSHSPEHPNASTIPSHNQEFTGYSRAEQVLATSRGDYQQQAHEIGVSYFRDADDFCEEHPDVVILACAILSLEKVVGALPLQRLRRSTLIVDVLSVKQFPKQLLLSLLPPEVIRVQTHSS